VGSCIGRLATTPDHARALLADAVAIVQARAAQLAAEGRRTWEPSSDAPALIILIDEYAELADDAAEAMPDADTVARLGRAVAVTLIAATQRPTQKAMGQGAVRSQMDLRIAFRVRERKDVDLILGQGMLAAGWQAHTLSAPGKFLVSAPEHTSPKRARAYLLTDQAVADTAARYAGQRPELDDTSQRAMQTGPATPAADPARDTGPSDPAPSGADPGGTEATADDALWLALCVAPDEGTDVAELLRVTGMSRPTLYRRLVDHAKAGRANQVSRGRWRAQMTQEPPRD
jgi:DNA segregation ATPase FtsK/SpoIIIE-like protein